MADIIRCPNCEKQLRLQEPPAGEQVRCPLCQAVFTPTPGPPPRAIPVGPDEAITGGTPRPPRGKKRRRDREEDRDEQADYDFKQPTMPASVIGAVAAMCVILGLNVLLMLLIMVRANLSPEQMADVCGGRVISFGLGGLILWGLIAAIDWPGNGGESSA